MAATRKYTKRVKQAIQRMLAKAQKNSNTYRDAPHLQIDEWHKPISHFDLFRVSRGQMIFIFLEHK